jgi:peroxiredoxin
MQYTTRFLFSLLVLALLSACGVTEKGATLSGKVKGADNMQVLMEQFHFDGKNKAIGKVAADGSGSFKINDEAGFEKGIYRLQIGAKQVFFILDGTEKKVSLEGDLATLTQMTDIKSEGSEAMACYIKKIGELTNIAKQGQFTPEIAKEQVAQACNPLMGALMTSQFFGQQAANFLPEFKLAAEKLSNDMPNSKYATDYAKNISNLELQVAQQSAGTAPGGKGISVGSVAPEINLPDPSGKNRSLHALKGKVVLLDFWASWCRPCRMENPNVVKVYNKYKDKGFTVYSVSLDRENAKDAWVQAIKQDGLVWPDHVSELKFWTSTPGALYGVQSIPQTFLIDREGKIAAVNPRSNLEDAVKKAMGI